LLRTDDIILLPDQEPLSTITNLAKALSELPADIHVMPLGSIELLAASRIVEFGNMATMRVFQSPLSPVDRVSKRIFDLFCAIVGLLLLSPLLVLVPIAIRLDSPGPALFRQTRHGYNNEPIRVFKFRTMSVIEDGDNFRAAVRDDRRVTRLGRILRRTNIDELPQLFNVLVGDMSIVGPRPHATAHNNVFEGLISSFGRRHNVKPGITGWAQVNGYRGEADTIEKMGRRVEYDLYYIDHWSFMFDIEIILMTLISKASYANAY
jgi:Undecaprenyl-phosphate glucose phosphotransferase